MDRELRFKSRPMATTRRRASSGTIFGYTSPHHKQFIEAPDRSGLYYFHAKGESGKFFSFPWIVAPQQPRSKIAVLASNITWNAYDSFGSRNNYIHPDSLPSTPIVNARLELHRYTGSGAYQLWHRRLRPIVVRPARTDLPHSRRGRHYGTNRRSIRLSHRCFPWHRSMGRLRCASTNQFPRSLQTSCDDLRNRWL